MKKSVDKVKASVYLDELKKQVSKEDLRIIKLLRSKKLKIDPRPVR